MRERERERESREGVRRLVTENARCGVRFPLRQLSSIGPEQEEGVPPPSDTGEGKCPLWLVSG